MPRVVGGQPSLATLLNTRSQIAPVGFQPGTASDTVHINNYFAKLKPSNPPQPLEASAFPSSGQTSLSTLLLPDIPPMAASGKTNDMLVFSDFDGMDWPLPSEPGPLKGVKEPTRLGMSREPSLTSSPQMLLSNIDPELQEQPSMIKLNYSSEANLPIPGHDLVQNVDDDDAAISRLVEYASTRQQQSKSDDTNDPNKNCAISADDDDAVITRLVECASTRRQKSKFGHDNNLPNKNCVASTECISKTLPTGNSLEKPEKQNVDADKGDCGPDVSAALFEDLLEEFTSQFFGKKSQLKSNSLTPATGINGAKPSGCKAIVAQSDLKTNPIQCRCSSRLDRIESQLIQHQQAIFDLLLDRNRKNKDQIDQMMRVTGREQSPLHNALNSGSTVANAERSSIGFQPPRGSTTNVFDPDGAKCHFKAITPPRLETRELQLASLATSDLPSMRTNVAPTSERDNIKENASKVVAVTCMKDLAQESPELPNPVDTKQPASIANANPMPFQIILATNDDPTKQKSNDNLIASVGTSTNNSKLTPITEGKLKVPDPGTTQDKIIALSNSEKLKERLQRALCDELSLDV